MIEDRDSHPGSQRGSKPGFTLVEMLIVIGLIVTLLTILLVALAATTNRAAEARTSTLLTSMSQGVTQFRRDLRYLPPILDINRRLLDASFVVDDASLQNWFSLTSPAEYLLGYGNAAADGAQGLGLRDPGIDRVWGAASSGVRSPKTSGKIHGPYMQVEDDDLLAGQDPSDGRIYAPTDPGYDSAFPKVILDYWGQPIRYYIDHPTRGYSLGDVYILRPYRMTAGTDSEGIADASGNQSTTFALKSAEFAFFSTGSDRTANQNFRFDDPNEPGNNTTSFNNEDNIVETGR